VPVLVLGLGVDMRYAAGASLMAVIATSCGAAATYVREGFTNVRIGMFLEVATTLGAIGGASLAAVAPGSGVAVIFGVVLLASVYWSARPELGAKCEMGRKFPLKKPFGRRPKGLILHQIGATRHRWNFLRPACGAGR